jgi:hypothetical protein
MAVNIAGKHGEVIAMIPETLSHFRVLEEIGAGGMGVVYRAHDEQLDRDVALKVLPSGLLADESARRRFRREALALAKLNHPNVGAVYEFGGQDGVDFLVMELVSGVPLNARLSSGPLPTEEVLRLGTQLAEGLEEAHAQGDHPSRSEARQPAADHRRPAEDPRFRTRAVAERGKPMPRRRSRPSPRHTSAARFRTWRRSNCAAREPMSGPMCTPSARSCTRWRPASVRSRAHPDRS